MARSTILFPTGRQARAILMMSVLVLGHLVPNVAAAQQAAKEPSSAEERMLTLNEEGFSAFAEGEFAEAARKFEKAHTFVADPILRKNAAIAWFKAGRCEEASQAAIFFLLADEMTVKDRVEARSVLGHCRLEEAEQAIEAGKKERAQAIVERVDLLQTDERVEQRLSSLRMRLGVGRSDVSQAASPNIAGWTLVATGAAVLAGTVGYHILSANDEDQLQALGDSAQNSRRRQQLEDSVDTARWLVPTLYAAGGLSTGAGVWLVISNGPGQPQETAKPAAHKAPAPAVQVGLSFEF